MVTGIFIVSGVYVFVTVNPVVSPVIATVYPLGTGSSFIVYAISTPFAFLGNPVNVPFQPFASFNVNVFPVSTPSANNFIVTAVALFPSWLLLSFHTLVTGMFISGINTNFSKSSSSCSPW